MTKSPFKLKNGKNLWDFKSENQGLSKAKAKARKRAGQIIFNEGNHESIMEKGRRMKDALTEINKYTDY